MVMDHLCVCIMLQIYNSPVHLGVGASTALFHTPNDDYMGGLVSKNFVKTVSIIVKKQLVERPLQLKI